LPIDVVETRGNYGVYQYKTGITRLKFAVRILEVVPFLAMSHIALVFDTWQHAPHFFLRELQLLRILS